MEEELTYVMVTFKTKDEEKPNDLEIIYEEVKAVEQTLDTNSVKQENEKKAPRYTLLHLVAAGLGIICVVLLSVIVALSVHWKTVMAEKDRDGLSLTAQKQLLWEEKTVLERQMEELSRERDGLNWTMGVILEYETFPVRNHCPQKVCKPCLEGWVPFQSSCYKFSTSEYYYHWRKWQESRENCGQMNADLVVIESQEEQEFINNHTEAYDDQSHGYWIGLSKKDAKSTWTWVDGSNITVTYWKSQEPGYTESCVLSQPRADALANWHKVSCYMKNRWICEMRALIKLD